MRSSISSSARRTFPRITPPRLGFRILTPAPLTTRCGLMIDYTVRVLGMPTHWRSEIAEYDPPGGFRDVQVIGPYRLWDHRHRFRRESGGTLIEDFVVYEPPLGPLGGVRDALMIRRQLASIFEYRRRRHRGIAGRRRAGERVKSIEASGTLPRPPRVRAGPRGRRGLSLHAPA